MKKLKNFAKTLWNDEGGQGMAEYVLLLVIIVAIVFAFKDKIKSAITTKMDSVGSDINGFNAN
jgi:Flp pilus assembly pilin Flp